MKRTIAITGVAALIGLGAASAPTSNAAPKTATVTVYCGSGDTAAHVTPAHLTIALGDSVEWQSNDDAPADTIDITLKDAKRVWPFAGRLAKRGRHARAHAAHTRGTYAYNVGLQCPVAGGGTHHVVIDPDLIIQ